jgi:hypothetical protein
LKDVRDREIKNYKESGGTNYLSWIIGGKSPFDKRELFIELNVFRHFRTEILVLKLDFQKNG